MFLSQESPKSLLSAQVCHQRLLIEQRSSELVISAEKQS